MKRNFYIWLFVILGFLAQFFLHALIENWYISLLLVDFDRYAFGLTWSDWFKIHKVLTFVFVLAGVWLGYQQGRWWWPRLYDENGRRHQG